MPSAMEINIYINVAILGLSNQVLNDFLKKIECSGLYESCNYIKLAVNGDIDLLKIDFKDFLNKILIIQTAKEIDQYEFPGLKQLWEDSQKSNFHILYLHTKGVSRLPDRMIMDWINYLVHFNIIKWKDRISDLKTFDCSGVNLEGDTASLQSDPGEWGVFNSKRNVVVSPIHYSGNFWWSNSNYIKRLPDPYRWIPDDNYRKWRIMAEMWVCQLNGKFKSAWQSGVNHYREPYPDYIYLDDRNSTFQIELKRKAFHLGIIIIRLKRTIKTKVQILRQYCKRLLIN